MDLGGPEHIHARSMGERNQVSRATRDPSIAFSNRFFARVFVRVSFVRVSFRNAVRVFLCFLLFEFYLVLFARPRRARVSSRIFSSSIKFPRFSRIRRARLLSIFLVFVVFSVFLASVGLRFIKFSGFLYRFREFL